MRELEELKQRKERRMDHVIAASKEGRGDPRGQFWIEAEADLDRAIETAERINQANVEHFRFNITEGVEEWRVLKQERDEARALCTNAHMGMLILRGLTPEHADVNARPGSDERITGVVAAGIERWIAAYEEAAKGWT